MNKKGLTIVELIVTFSLTTVISLFLIQVILFLKDTYMINGIKSEMVLKQSLISDRINTLLNENNLIGVDSCGDNCYSLEFLNSDSQMLSFDNNTGKVVIGDYTTTLPKGSSMSNITFSVNNLNTKDNVIKVLNIKTQISNDLLKNEVYNINIISEIKEELSFQGYYENFAYTGGVQIFTSPISGYYKLEVWGAQGGNQETYPGGYGGYSKGVIYLTGGTNLAIVVGGKGGNFSKTVKVNGGYNGGGAGGLVDTSTTNVSEANKQGGSAGGGATHISTTNRGELKEYKNYLNEVILVSGGGGGGTNRTYGGSGGGYIGCSGGFSEEWPDYHGVGGTQKIGGYDYVTTSNYATFGLGSDLNEVGFGGNGGGGGLYGGGGTNRSHSGGGGGSGYIGNPLLTDKYMYCYNCTTSDVVDTKTYTTICFNEIPTENCAKMGNGYARITYLEK